MCLHYHIMQKDRAGNF